MANFDRSGGAGGASSKKYGKKDFGKRSFDDRGAGRPGMHKATCADCGNPCEVPFKPTGLKPIYCRNCFKRDDDTNSRRPDDRSYGNNRDFGRDARPEMHKATCTDCGSPCEVPFRPSANKPVFCNNCFKRGGTGAAAPSYSAPSRSFSPPTSYAAPSVNKNSEPSKAQFEMLNAKLDNILKLLTPPSKKAAQEQVVVEEKKVPKSKEAVQEPAKEAAPKKAKEQVKEPAAVEKKKARKPKKVAKN